MIKLTQYTPISGGKPIGKEFSLDENGELVKGTNLGLPVFCRADVLTFPLGLVDICGWLNEWQDEVFAVGHHVPKVGGDGPFLIATTSTANDKMWREKMLDEHPQTEGWRVIARSDSSMKRAIGDDGRCLIPVDYDPAGVPLAPAEVLGILAQVEPLFAKAGCVYFASSSSYLTVDGVVKKGAGGARFLFEGDAEGVSLTGKRANSENDPANLATIFDILVKRLVIAGHFTAKVRKQGVLHLATIIDPALANVVQPDFWGAPNFADPRIGRARPPIVYREGPVVQLRDIKPLTPEEVAAYDAIYQDQLAINADEIAANKAAHTEDRVARTKTQLAKEGRTVDENEIRQRLIKADRDRRLSLTDVIFVDNMDQWVLCSVIAANFERFDGLSCSSPSDPFYKDPTQTKTARHKGKIVRSRGEVGVIDFVTGQPTFYQIDTLDFVDILSTNQRAEREGDAVAKADLAKERDLLIDPPPVAESILAYPMVAAEDVGTAVAGLINRAGAVTTVGLPMEREGLRHIAEHGHKGQIIVPDTESAVGIKHFLQRVDPSLKVAIIPSRTADADEIRKTHGEDALEYFDEFGGRHGMKDILCEKRDAVIALHKAGFVAVLGQVCVRKVGETTISCEYMHTCGFWERARAIGHSDVHIRAAKGLLGVTSPLALGKEAPPQPSDTLLLLTDEMVLADRHEWPMQVFETTPVLTEFLGMLRNAENGEPGRAPDGFWDRLGEYVGSTGISPATSPADALEKAKHYYRAKTKKGSLPSPAAIGHAIEAYSRREATFLPVGDTMLVRAKPILRRVAGSQVLLASANGPSAPRVANLISKIAGTSPLNGGRKITRAAEIKLPSYVLQVIERVGEKAGRKTAAQWCAPGKVGSTPQPNSAMRDLKLGVRVLLETQGPGILITTPSDQVTALFGDLAGLTILSRNAFGVASVCDDGALHGARWVMVLGLPNVVDARLRDALVDLPSDQWGEDAMDPTKPITRRVRPEFFTRSGGSVRPGFVGYRRAGVDQASDLTVFGLVTSPAIRAAEVLAAMEASDGLARQLIVVSNSPLAHPAALSTGVLVDEVRPFEQVFPPAVSVLNKLGMNATQIGAELGMTAASVRKQLQRAKAKINKA